MTSSHSVQPGSATLVDLGPFVQNVGDKFQITRPGILPTTSQNPPIINYLSIHQPAVVPAPSFAGANFPATTPSTTTTTIGGFSGFNTFDSTGTVTIDYNAIYKTDMNLQDSKKLLENLEFMVDSFKHPIRLYELNEQIELFDAEAYEI